MPNSEKICMIVIFHIFLLLTSCETTKYEEDIQIIPRWTKGEKLEYSLVKTRRKLEDGKETLRAKSTCSVNVEVVKADGDEYLVDWTFGETRIEDPDQAANPMVKAIMNIAKGLKIQLELDADANMLGVKNWRELQGKSQEVIAAITNELKKADMDETVIQGIEQIVTPMFSTKEQIEMMCTNEVQTFFFPVGLRNMRTSPMEYHDQLPNPLGGEPLPSIAKIALKKYNPNSDTVLLHWKQEIDPVLAKKIMEKTLKNMSGSLGQTMPVDIDFGPLLVSDKAECLVSCSTGWPQWIKHSRTTKVGNNLREDSMIFERLK